VTITSINPVRQSEENTTLPAMGAAYAINTYAMAQCWATLDNGEECTEVVPANAEHIGLCRRHIELYQKLL